MAISRLILSMLMLGFVFFVSCSKDETTPTQTDNFTKTMTASIDGIPWDGSSTATVQKSGTITTVKGIGPIGQQIILTFNDPIMNHFTSLNLHSIQLVEGGTNVWSTKPGGSSVVTIDTVSSTIIGGSFSFIAVPISDQLNGNKVVKDGKFSIKF